MKTRGWRETADTEPPATPTSAAVPAPIDAATSATTGALVPFADAAHAADLSEAELAARLAELPREAGWLLVTAGMVGVVLPGIIGTPFLVAGAMMLAPGGTRLLSRLARRHPDVARPAIRQIDRFLDDLERRYPRR
jgi:hypothetical protein